MIDGFFQPKDTNRSLPIALLRTREAIMARFRPMLTRHGLTEQQWRVIRVLAEQDEIEVAQLAQRSSILGPSLSRILKNLEAEGLVRKRKDRSDGRVFWLSLEKKGTALIKRVQPDSEAIYRNLESRLGVERIDALLDSLNEIAELIALEQDNHDDP